jgi:hypothetical protein
MAMKAMKAMKVLKKAKKAMKAMKAMKVLKKAEAKKVLKKAQAQKAYPLTVIFVKSWASCYEGQYRNWRLTELKNKAGIVTEVWTGAMKK